jgi:hypothetical protein
MAAGKPPRLGAGQVEMFLSKPPLGGTHLLAGPFLTLAGWSSAAETCP